MRNNNSQKQSTERTIRQTKDYAHYGLVASVPTDFVLEVKNWKEILNYFAKLFPNLLDTPEESFLSFMKPTVYNDESPFEVIPRVGFIEAELEDIEMETRKMNRYSLFHSKEEAEAFLQILSEHNLMFDGYIYQTKYSDWVCFYVSNVFGLSAKYWTGKWKDCK